MRALLDTHAFLWMLGEPDRFSRRAHAALSDEGAEIHVSVVSLWEIVIKRRAGKLAMELNEALRRLAPETRLRRLDLLPAHLAALDRLPAHPAHRDPFDHLLIAQATAEGLTFVSADRHVALYDVPVLPP